MFGFMSFGLFIILSLIEITSAGYCYDGRYSYYCSPGQSCGSHYGDCRGLPTYAIITIISTSILLLSICIRCCVQLNSSNTRSTPQNVPLSVQNPRHVAVPVYNVREGAPPSYDIATSSSAEQAKY